jgi:hypothetical protein
MTTSIPALITLWRTLDVKHFPYVLPGDEAIENTHWHRIRNYYHYLQSPDLCTNNKSCFHLNLLPVPYGGDILNAKIYILALNPGFGAIDYYSETTDPSFIRHRINQIRQQKLNKRFPWIDPKWSWHGGFKYWTDKLGNIIEEVERLGNARIRTPYHSYPVTLPSLNMSPIIQRPTGMKLLSRN